MVKSQMNSTIYYLIPRNLFCTFCCVLYTPSIKQNMIHVVISQLVPLNANQEPKWTANLLIFPRVVILLLFITASVIKNCFGLKEHSQTGFVLN